MHSAPRSVPFSPVLALPLLSLSSANPRTENWTAPFLLPLPFPSLLPPSPSIFINSSSFPMLGKV